MEATLVIVTLMSLALAISMAIVAWCLLQQERERAEARVAALEEGLAASLAADPPPTAVNGSGLSGLHLNGNRGALAVSVAGGVIVLLMLALWSVGRLMAPGVGADSRGAGPARASAVAAAAAPLELVALEQTRAGDQLTLHGTVRNPPAGLMIDRLAVVVAFFDVSGQQLASVRAPLDYRTLAPGDESPFQVTTSVPAGVTRYRVSFRRDEGTIVPHVDRRQQEAS